MINGGDIADMMMELGQFKQHARPTHCHADSDGDCDWEGCPQLESWQSHCPLDKCDLCGETGDHKPGCDFEEL